MKSEQTEFEDVSSAVELKDTSVKYLEIKEGTKHAKKEYNCEGSYQDTSEQGMQSESKYKMEDSGLSSRRELLLRSHVHDETENIEVKISVENRKEGVSQKDIVVESEKRLGNVNISDDSSDSELIYTDTNLRKYSKPDYQHSSKSKRHCYDEDEGRIQKKRRKYKHRKFKKWQRTEESSGSSSKSTDSEHKSTENKTAVDYKNLPRLVAEYSGSDRFDEESSDSIKTSESEDSSSKTDISNSDTVNVVAKDDEDENKIDTCVLNEALESDGESPTVYFPAIEGCRNVTEYEILSRIAEGSYGVVYQAKDKHTEQIVALKKLKMEKEKEGFPITSLREINTLLKAQHPNIVTVREIVVNSNIDKIFIVMDYVEHDLKSFMESMKKKKEIFQPGEVKCLMLQLLRAVAHLHDNWILHRDIKTSNLLLSNKGILKVGDFGLAREYGSPLKPYSPVVVTLWYRAPEVLLGARRYSTSIDVWSIGCIFSELITMETLFQSKTEVEQINRIFRSLGTPNDKMWPGFSLLPAMLAIKVPNYPPGRIWKQFNNKVTYNGMQLLMRFLTYDPAKRVTAKEAEDHDYFKEAPLPVDPKEFAAAHVTDDTCHKISDVPSPKVQRNDDKLAEEFQDGFFMGLQETGNEDSTSFRLRF